MEKAEPYLFCNEEARDWTEVGREELILCNVEGPDEVSHFDFLIRKKC